MGYWDKKEPKKVEPKEVEGKKVENYNPEDINHEALKELESDSNDSAENILKDVEGIANDIARQKKQFSDLLSTSYWCAIVFNNTDQKQNFLLDMGFDPNWTFIPGKEFAKRCGCPVKIPDREYKERGKQQAFADRARSLPEKD